MNEKNDLFPGDGDFSKLVKKAQRKSLIRNIVVSVIVSSLLIFGLMWLGTYLMYKNMENENNYDYASESIRGANVELGGSHYNYTLFSASVITSSTKYVAGVPVPWETRKKSFSIFGASQPVQAPSYSGRGSIEDDRMVMYFEGERLVEFYSPDLDYEFLPDERPLLEGIDGNKVVEMAFSFDAAYGIEEVEEQFAELADWYWVDVSTPTGGELQQPVYGYEAYGFFQGRDVMESAGMFIRQLEWLREEEGEFQAEAGRIYDVIAGGNSSEAVTADELAISGVVVTGSPEELQAFSDLPMVRAAVLGATTDKY